MNARFPGYPFAVDNLPVSLEEQRLNIVLNAAELGIWDWDLDAKTIIWNQPHEFLFGYDPGTARRSEEDFFSRIHSSDRDRIIKLLREASRDGREYQAEYRVVWPDGSVHWLQARGRSLRDPASGRPTRMLGVVMDISSRKKMEEALAESEERLAIALESAQMGTWIWDPRDNTLICTDTLKRLWGYEPEEWKNSLEQFWQRLHPDDVSIVEKIREGAWESGVFELEYRVVWPDKSIHWIYCKGRAQFDINGEPLRFAGTAMDITTRKQSEIALRRSKEALQAIIDNTPAVVYVKDRNSRLLLANKELEKILGLRAEEILGKSDHDFWEKEYADELRGNDLKVFDTGKPLAIEERVVVDGVVRTYIVNKFPVYIEGHDNFVVCGISMDITERIQAENELHLLSAELRRSNKELEQFASVASHDLKEPIRMVTSYLQLLSKKAHGTIDENCQGYLDFAIENSKRMCDLVDSLLKYARMGSKDLELKEVNVDGLLKDVISNLSSAIEESKVNIHLDALPLIRGDGLQLSQLFQNLISNGIKFRRKEAAPKLRVSCEEGSDEWVFAVEDNGIGISPKSSQEIFDIFRRLNPHNEYPGEGIGLATCKRIVERHRGRIWVSQNSDGGLTFCFSLPK